MGALITYRALPVMGTGLLTSLSSFTMKCDGNNLFIEIRSLDSVAGFATDQPTEGEQVIGCFWPPDWIASAALRCCHSLDALDFSFSD